MKSSCIALSVAAALSVGCASSPENAEASARIGVVEPASAASSTRDAAVADVPRESGTDDTGAAPASTSAARERGDVGRMTAVQLELWDSPAFQAEFTRSYLSETEIEPTITAPERERMQKVLVLLSDPVDSEASTEGLSETQLQARAEKNDALRAENQQKAIALLEKNLGEATSAVFDFTLANLYLQGEELERALDHYGDAVRKHPKFRRAWNNLGFTHVRLGNFREAAEAFTKVLELGGGSATTYGLLGFAYGNVSNHLSAESAYRMAILMDPATIDWKMGLARSLFEQQRYADAVALCDTLIVDEPERADLWMLQGNAYLGMQQPARAAENFELVDQLGGSTSASLNILGDIYINDSLFELAVDCYVRALEMDAESDVSRALRAAQVLTARGAYPETEALVTRIEELRGDRLQDAERKDLLRLRARMAVARGAGDEEAAILEQIVALDPLDGDALILLGQHAERSGDPEQAIFYFERAANLEEFEADAKVRHAQLLVGQKNYGQALPLLERAQAIKPRQAIADYLEQVKRLAKPGS